MNNLLCMFDAMKQVRCQSCGMPLDRDPGKGGTEKDGMHSTKYCSLCYEKGHFIRADCTLDEMGMIVDRAMRSDGMGWIMRKIALLQLPRLERWKKK